jgi:hypothetical protein
MSTSSDNECVMKCINRKYNTRKGDHNSYTIALRSSTLLDWVDGAPHAIEIYHYSLDKFMSPVRINWAA